MPIVSPVGRDDLNARARAGPDVAVDVAAQAVGERGRRLLRVGARNGQLRVPPAVARRLAVDVEHADLAARAGVGDIQALVVGREAEAVGAGDFVGDHRHLAGGGSTR